MVGKTVVMGCWIETTREVRAKVIPTCRRDVLQKEILDQVDSRSKIYTDEAIGIDRTWPKEIRARNREPLNEYVRGQVHTQGIENFW